MSIRPIDMQVTIQKSDLYTKEFNHNAQINNSQQGLSVETQKKAIEKQRQVISTEASENNRIDGDGSNRSKEGKDRHKKSKENNDKARESKIRLIEDDKGAFIDLII